jgi:hypothetical protein
MNINKTLSDFFNENDFQITEDEDKKNILKFLNETCMEEKYDLAQDLMGMIVKKTGKEQFESMIAELRKVECATMSITTNRDHVVHSLNTFFLGLYINKKYLNEKVHLLDWTLAALFHDVAYPAKISQQIIENYLKKMKSINEALGGESFDPVINLNPNYFEKLTNNKNAFKCIQERIYEWKLDVNVKKSYNHMICSNKINHGILSALTILYLVDLMYQKYSWHQDNFKNHIVPACSAIFLHDLEDDAFMKIDKTIALPYLLKLCDELQTWQRPKNGLPNGKSPHDYDIAIENDTINFSVKNINEKDDILKRINCLKDKNITVNGIKCYNSKNLS